MDNDSMRALVSAATVRVTGRGGQGVLIPGGFILTAAHCIDWDTNGKMVLGEHFEERIVTSDGRELFVAPVAVEPVADIAVLGAMDIEELYDKTEAYGARLRNWRTREERRWSRSSFRWAMLRSKQRNVIWVSVRTRRMRRVIGWG
jgi:trypsin